ALTWWLTAPCVTQSSSAARVKLSCRAAASKTFKAFSGGRRGRIAKPHQTAHEKNWGRPEKGCFAGCAQLSLIATSDITNHSIWSRSMSTLFSHGDSVSPPSYRGAVARRHQSSSWSKLLETWRLWEERSRQRAALRDIADDPHLLADLGLTRDGALDQADKPFWR